MTEIGTKARSPHLIATGIVVALLEDGGRLCAPLTEKFKKRANLARNAGYVGVVVSESIQLSFKDIEAFAKNANPVSGSTLSPLDFAKKYTISALEFLLKEEIEKHGYSCNLHISANEQGYRVEGTVKQAEFLPFMSILAKAE